MSAANLFFCSLRSIASPFVLTNAPSRSCPLSGRRSRRHRKACAASDRPVSGVLRPGRARLQRTPERGRSPRVVSLAGRSAFHAFGHDSPYMRRSRRTRISARWRSPEVPGSVAPAGQANAQAAGRGSMFVAHPWSLITDHRRALGAPSAGFPARFSRSCGSALRGRAASRLRRGSAWTHETFGSGSEGARQRASGRRVARQR